MKKATRDNSKTFALSRLERKSAKKKFCKIKKSLTLNQILLTKSVDFI